MLNEKIKRAAVLDLVQGREIAEGFTREQLRALYEQAYDQLKREQKGTDKKQSTGLDFNQESLEERKTKAAIKGESGLAGEQKRQDELVSTMKRMGDASSTGHAWIETNSKDKDGKDRVRFTMGFFGKVDPKMPWETVPGILKNPDSNDNKGANNQKKVTITKPQYLKALDFAMGYNENRYSLMAENCTTFATKMAAAAGVNIGGAVKLPFIDYGIYAPDKMAPHLDKATEQDMASKHEYKPDVQIDDSNDPIKMTVDGEVIEIPVGADKMNIATMKSLMVDYCKKNEKYVSEIEREQLSKRDITDLDRGLSADVRHEIKELNNVQSMYLKKDLQAYKDAGMKAPGSVMSALADRIVDKTLTASRQVRYKEFLKKSGVNVVGPVEGEKKGKKKKKGSSR